MLKEKLLTLGCVISILAIGACFLPPPQRKSPPPPPPLRVDLKQIHSVAVTVLDPDLPQHPGLSNFASAIVLAINNYSWNTGFSAHPTDHAQPPPDATLVITILSATAAPEPINGSGSTTHLTLGLIHSATLTSADGRVLWQELNVRSTFHAPLPPAGLAHGWDDTQMTHRFMQSIAGQIVVRMLYRK
ncbi:MAG TPA: hypothetical protein VK716_15395 [Terracidiphilus sp.]|jgi:hypothetical protein|nr:hypothetical protein [Terracidiphilus sp.]